MMAKGRRKKIDPYERKHLQLLSAIERKIQRSFQGLHLSTSVILEGVPYDSINLEEGFDLSRFPHLEAQINNLTKRTQDDILKTIQDAVRSTYAISTNKAIDMVERYLGDRDAGLYIDTLHRAGSATAFQEQWFDKHPISERVWNITDQFKREVEDRITSDLLSGTPADQISRNIREFLNEPQKLFRRVRGEDGVLRLSKNAKAYHPGQGVYRSAYKNARRLAVTETNNAYRKADSDRWQKLDFVIGVRVQLSNNHTYRDHKGRLRTLVDICDDLKGDYPKDFVFTSWHPHCRCIATPILKSRAEMKADRERILRGEEPTQSPNEIKEMPANFKRWAMSNKERLSNAQSKGTIPHWIKDNFTVRKNGTLRSHSHEKQVQKAWLKRNRQQSLEMAKKALIGTTAHHAQIGEIHFTGNLIKEAINQPHKNLYYKNLSIIEMRSIIPRATFEGSSLDTKGRGWKFHYLKYNLRGEPAYIVIREIKGKNTFYSIVEQLNKK